MSNRTLLSEPLRLALLNVLSGPNAVALLLELASRLTISARANYEREGFGADRSAAQLRLHNEALIATLEVDPLPWTP